jgi:hypothetical protein
MNMQAAGKSKAGNFPREIAKNVFWFGNCVKFDVDGEVLHAHFGIYLLIGKDRTLLVDTGVPRYWPSQKIQMDAALAGRPLDYVFITHLEVPHSTNLPNILESYPQCRVVGDARDFHLFYPQYTDRMDPKTEGDEVDLGDLRLKFIPAVLKDLPGSLWAYESAQQVMFVADGFAFAHSGSDDPLHDDPLHRPGECTFTSSELLDGLEVGKGEMIVRTALYWSRYVDPDSLFEKIGQLLAIYPTKVICPAHSNVIVDIERALPIVKQTHLNAFQSASLATSPSHT